MSLLPEKSRAAKLPKLTIPSEYQHWRDSLAAKVFELTRKNTDITIAATLNAAYFKDRTAGPHAAFRQRVVAASKDDQNNDVDPFVQDPGLSAECFEHALNAGGGFHT